VGPQEVKLMRSSWRGCYRTAESQMKDNKLRRKTRWYTGVYWRAGSTWIRPTPATNCCTSHQLLTVQYDQNTTSIIPRSLIWCPLPTIVSLPDIDVTHPPAASESERQPSIKWSERLNLIDIHNIVWVSGDRDTPSSSPLGVIFEIPEGSAVLWTGGDRVEEGHVHSSILARWVITFHKSVIGACFVPMLLELQHCEV